MNRCSWGKLSTCVVQSPQREQVVITGIHSRYGHAPRWVVEGLGTMFEARGVWDSRKYTQLSDRINHGRLQQYHRLMKHRKWSGISDLVSSTTLRLESAHWKRAMKMVFLGNKSMNRARWLCMYALLNGL